MLRRAAVRAHGVVAGAVRGRAARRTRRGARRGSRCPRLESCPMAQIVVPFRGENGKQRLDTSDDARSQLALAMLGDVLAAATVTGRTLVVTDDKAGRALAAELGAEPLADAPGGQGAAVAAALERLGEGTVLVVNADVPVRRPARPAHARGRGRARRDRLRRGRGRDDERAGAAGAAISSRRSTARGSAARFRDHADSLGVAGDLAARSRTSRDDVDTLDDLDRIGLRAGPRTQAAIGRALQPVKVVAPLRRRRRRALRTRPRRCGRRREIVTIVGNVGDDLEVLGLPSRPTSTASSTRSPGSHDEERGWGRAGETWHALETVSSLGGEDWFRLGDRDLGLHLVRTQALRAGEPLSAVTARLARALGLEPAILPATDDRAPHLDRHAGRAASRSRSGSSRAATATRSTASASRARRTPAPGRARGARGGRRDPDRAQQPVREHLADPRRAGDPGGARARAASRASPSARSSAAARSRARQTVCSRGWRAARHRRTSRAATRA